MSKPILLAPGAHVVGDVTMGDDCTVWYNAVIRADADAIVMGDGVNIQDGCVLHVDEGSPMHLADRVTVGHNAILHGCTVGRCSMIGMGSIVLNGANIGENVLLGAGSLVPQGMVIPNGVLALGSPAKVKRPLTEEEIANLDASAQHYIDAGKKEAMLY